MNNQGPDATFGASKHYGLDDSILGDQRGELDGPQQGGEADSIEVEKDSMLDDSVYKHMNELSHDYGQDCDLEISNEQTLGHINHSVTACFPAQDDLTIKPETDIEDRSSEHKKQNQEEEPSFELDEPSDQESEMGEKYKPAKKSEEEIMRELFPDMLLDRLSDDKEIEQANHITNLRNMLVANYKMLYEEVMPKHLLEVKNYENTIEILQKKKKDYYELSKLEFYDQKVTSLKKLTAELERDWHKIADEIKRMIEKPQDANLVEEVVDNFNRRLAIATSKIESRLPIYSKKSEILDSLKNNRVTVIKGKPGCGKSTQLPIMLFENDLVGPKKKMFMITPRQVAANQIYRRVAKEMLEDEQTEKNGTLNCFLLSGSLYKLKTSCSLIFSTDSEFYRRLVVTKEIKPEDIEYLVIDEVNSKKMYTELIISLSRKLLKKFSHLKVVFLCTNFSSDVMNNYFRIEKAKDLFTDKNIIEIAEKNFHTELVYLPHNADTENQIIEVLHQIEDRIAKRYKKNKCIKDANVLVFLSGAEEVRLMHRKFKWLDGKEGLVSSRLKELNANLKTYFRLIMACGGNTVTYDEELFKDNDCTESIKLIFSTKILETSLTIPHLGFVVDFGMECIYTWDYSVGTLTKTNKRISQDTAGQREGRTGRTARGVCFRMYKEEDFDTMEPHAESELVQKNIDILVMSLIRLICESKKDGKEPEFFDRIGERVEIQNPHPKRFINELASELLRFDFVTKLREDSVIWVLDLLYKLELIKEDKERSESIDVNALKDFTIILVLGVEPKFGKAIIEAYMRYKAHQQRDPESYHWILSELIDVVATNSYNRRIVFDTLGQSESMELHKEATRLSQTYGDFAYNYYIFKKSPSLNPKELGLHEGTLRKFKEICLQIRARARGLFKLGENYFKNWEKNRGLESEEETYKNIVECLIKGYIVDISKFINSDLGYFHVKIEKAVKFGIDTAFQKLLEVDETALKDDRYMVMADVVAKDSVLESKFAFRVPMNYLKSIYTTAIDHLEHKVNLENIPSKIYLRDDLSTVVLHNINFRIYYVQQILGKEGYVVEIGEKGLIFKVAITPKSFNRLTKKLEALINFTIETYKNYTYELGLKCCRVNVGNGLAIEDVMTNKDGVSTYFFLIPRFIQQKDGKEVILEKPDGNQDPWEFLTEKSRKYLGFDKIKGKVYYDTTYSKVNYNSDSAAMNLKIICNSTKTNEDVREKLRQQIKKWAEIGNPFQPELKFCERHLNKDVHCKPIQLRLYLSLTIGKGKVVLSASDNVSFAALENHMEEIKNSKEQTSIFGTSFVLKASKDKRSVHDRKIEVTGVPDFLDEMMIKKYFNSRGEYHLKDKVKIEVYKEELENEQPRETLEKDVRAVINKIIKDVLKDEALVDQFNIFVSHRLDRGYRNVKSCEIRVLSKDLANAIKEKLDGKYYTPMSDPCYRLGKQYTHVEEFDTPEFHVKKRLFIKIKQMLENINENIESTLKKKHSGMTENQMRDSVNKKRSEIKWDEERLNSTEDEENVKITLRKGEDKDLANNAENLLRNYFNGKEIPIKEEYYSFFFGHKGEAFLKELQASKETFVSIRRIENKSTLVVQEFKNSIEEKIREKIKQLDQEPIKRFHLKMNPSEIRKKEFEDDLKREFGKGNFGSKFEYSIVKGYHGLIILECEPQFMDQAKEKLKEITERHFSTSSNKSRFKCERCGHSGNLLRLLNCNHVYCTGCLQNSCTEQTQAARLRNVRGLDQPIFFCETEGCREPISCADIFNFMPDTLIEKVMNVIVDQMVESGSLPQTDEYLIVPCPGCTPPLFNKYYKLKANNRCYRCNTKLNLTTDKVSLVEPRISMKKAK